jgi:NADPH:quinone reductase-like Zn-dependent oxidoreductase
MALPQEIKQWETAQDGFSNLKFTTAPLPIPGPRELLVKIHTVSLNYRDTEVTMGLYNHHKSLSDQKPNIVPCSDMCGTIISLGSGSSIWKVGDRCLSTFNQTHLTGTITAKDMSSGLGLPLSGVLCEYRVFPEYGLVGCPAYLSDEEACTLPIAGVTAWMAVNGMRPLGQPGGQGEKILIQGTGGVAVNGLLIAKASGAEGEELPSLTWRS